MNKINKEIKISLAAICTVVLLFYGINFLKGVNMFKKSNIYYIVFHDITGLSKNNAVYANGFPIGTVQEISYDYQHPGTVYVGIEINEHMRLPKGSHAELVSNMLGTTTMNLLLSQNHVFLNPGDSIQGTPHWGVVQQATDMIPKFEKLLPKIDSILSSVNALLADPAIRQTLHNTSNVTANLQRTTNDLNHLLENDIPRLTAKMNHIGSNVDELTDKLKRPDYAQTIQNINQTVQDVQNFTRDLNDKLNSKNSLGLLLNDRNLYDNLNKTIVSSDSLVTNIKKHPKRYVHFSIFGRKDK
jgi:phospholipid/cholesterol/gamma-HCH transport system substrate-binding protein